MDEREFFDENESLKPATLSCLHCHQTEAYDIAGWCEPKRKGFRVTPMNETERVSPNPGTT